MVPLPAVRAAGSRALRRDVSSLVASAACDVRAVLPRVTRPVAQLACHLLLLPHCHHAAHHLLHHQLDPGPPRSSHRPKLWVRLVVRSGGCGGCWQASFRVPWVGGGVWSRPVVLAARRLVLCGSASGFVLPGLHLVLPGFAPISHAGSLRTVPHSCR